MTTAEMTQSQFLRSLTIHDMARDGEPTQEVMIASDFFRTKEVVDRILGLAMLIPLLPLIGMLILAVRLSSRGPGVFRQTRVGKGGRIFIMYKLRSMRVDAELGTGPVWSSAAKDPRVTLFGYWLRRLHLDELPQLFNVVRGEMSLVGPRPERPEFVTVLAEQIPGYLNRLTVQPGITGLAQINLPPDTDLDSVRRKLILDSEYIRTAGLSFDLRILVCTLLRTVGLRGGRSVRLMGLERTVKLPSCAAPGGDGTCAEPATPRRINAVADAKRSLPEASDQENEDFAVPSRDSSATSAT
jgi:lipopolysaccharide/colanic/teichoic acid biosynthesis glycosyltransferase